MYIPSHFAEDRPEVLHALMRRHPLATLVTLGASGLVANHIPLELHLEADGRALLRGHVARANPVWREVSGAVEALAIFQGPDSYISPSWYATKKEHGKVVPTWNYCTVHAYGAIAFQHDARWMHDLVSGLTQRHEAAMAEPWAVSDAPADYVQKMLENIVGLEIAVRRLDGKWKLSQNHPLANRAGVVEGLRQRGDEGALAMAALVRAQGGPEQG